MKTFELKFSLSEAEFLRGHRLYLRSAFLTMKNLSLMLVAFTLALAQAQILGRESSAIRVLVAMWVLLLLFMGYAYVFLPRRLFRRNPRFSEEHSVRIAPRGLQIRNGELKEEISWDEVSGVVEKHGLFFVIRKGHVPILIPIRAFGSEEELSGFRSFAHSHAQ